MSRGRLPTLQDVDVGLLPAIGQDQKRYNSKFNMQEKHKFMNAQSKKILNKKAGLHLQTGSHRKSTSRRSRSRVTIDNNDLDDVFSLKDEEFANMGYVDSMKM